MLSVVPAAWWWWLVAGGGEVEADVAASSELGARCSELQNRGDGGSRWCRLGVLARKIGLGQKSKRGERGGAGRWWWTGVAVSMGGMWEGVSDFGWCVLSNLQGSSGGLLRQNKELKRKRAVRGESVGFWMRFG